MVKLVDALGTRYIYATYGDPLYALMQNSKGETIDLADAHITRGCMDIIQQQGISTGICRFIDSKDPERNRLLEYNQTQAAMYQKFKSGEIKVLPLPTPRDMESMKQLFNKDYGDSYYKVPRTDQLCYLWAVLLQARRPDIKLYVLGYFPALLSTICKYYPSHRNIGKPVIYSIDSGSYAHSDCADAALCDTYNCVTDKFGRVNLFELENWQEPLRRMCAAYINLIKPRTHHIKEYL